MHILTYQVILGSSLPLEVQDELGDEACNGSARIENPEDNPLFKAYLEEYGYEVNSYMIYWSW